MKLRNIVPIFCLLVSLSCGGDPDPGAVCSLEDPHEELAWLHAEIEAMTSSDMSEYLYVTRAKYGVKTVFIFLNCCPNCNYVPRVYDCSGKHLGNIGTGQDAINQQILEHDVVIWKPVNSACNFSNTDSRR